MEVNNWYSTKYEIEESEIELPPRQDVQSKSIGTKGTELGLEAFDQDLQI